jgi:hypothetical protein
MGSGNPRRRALAGSVDNAWRGPFGPGIVRDIAPVFATTTTIGPTQTSSCTSKRSSTATSRRPSAPSRPLATRANTQLDRPIDRQ